MTTLTIRAYGRPAPQGSHDVGANGHVMHSSNYLAAWRRQVQIATLTAVKAHGYEPGSLPLFAAGEPVYVHELRLIVTDEQCRAADTDEPTGRPDVDKLLRATIDGLGDAQLFADDAQITKMHEISKVRAAPGEHSGATIIISDRPRSAAALEQGESIDMRDGEFMITLSRVRTDADGDRVYDDLLSLTGEAHTIVTAGVGAVASLLGAEGVSIALPEQASVVDSSAAREQQAELSAPAEEPKRPRGRPRKATAPAAAEPVAAAPVSESAPVAEPAAVPAPQAPAQPVADTEGETQAMRNVEPQPVAPAGRVNPFA